MAALYEINAMLQALFDSSVNEDGEIDEKALEQIEGLQLDRQVKIENIACMIKNLKSDAEQMKAEAKRLSDRAKTAENKAERLKNYLTMNLHGEKFQSPRAQIYFQNRTSLRLDEAELPKKYLIKVTDYKPDKVAISEALADGKKVKGAYMETKQSLVIK